MLTNKEKQIRKSVDLMFAGYDNDDTLKQVILACALDYSEEEKDRIAEELRRVNDQNFRDIKDKYKLSLEESIPLQTDLIVNGVVDLSGNLQSEK